MSANVREANDGVQKVVYDADEFVVLEVDGAGGRRVGRERHDGGDDVVHEEGVEAEERWIDGVPDEEGDGAAEGSGEAFLHAVVHAALVGLPPDEGVPVRVLRVSRQREGQAREEDTVRERKGRRTM